MLPTSFPSHICSSFTFNFSSIFIIFLIFPGKKRSMGEIDTDHIKSVRASLSHFGEKCSQIRSRSSSDDESEKMKDLEVVLQDLANCKVQLEAMDSAHKQALLNKYHNEKTVDELSLLLKTSEFEKDIYINECKEAKTRASEFESKIQIMADELIDLKSTRDHLLTVEKQLVVATDDKLEAIKHANELNDTILSLEKAKVEAEKHIELLESELTQLKLEIRGELETVKSDLEEMSNKENEAQVEIALLKAELHKGRSKTAAAEASELRAKSEKSAAYFALQQMAIENQELKNENESLKSENTNTNSEDEITISVEEYEMLVKKAEEVKFEPEIENLKKDLESAMARVCEFRTRAEQAATRAEVAEEAKAAVEEQIKRWKEQKQRRRAAMAALRAESMSKTSRSFEYEDNSTNIHAMMPLGKFLKMKL